MHVDTDAIRVGTGNIKRLDAAMPAKPVLGDSGVKGIGGKRVFALQQAKIRVDNDQVQETRLAADTAIAVSRLNNRRRVDFKSNLATMAPTFMGCHMF